MLSPSGTAPGSFLFNGYFFRLFLAGNFLRLVLAKSRSCFSLIDRTISFEAPLSDDFDRSPRFAARAAPAAICCFFDFAGIQKVTALDPHVDVEFQRWPQATDLVF